MPTKLRRIAVTEDPELAQALSRASKELPGLSDAALVKELAMRGAKTLPVKGSDERIARMIDRTGAQPARGDIRDYLVARGPLGEPDPQDPYKLSRILDEMREDKI